MKKLPSNVAAPEEFGKQRSKSEVVHRRVEITVEREVTSVLFCSATEHLGIKGRCTRCGQTIPPFESPPAKQQD